MRWPWKRTADEHASFPTAATPGEPEAFVDSGRAYFEQAWAQPDDTADTAGIEAFAVQTDQEKQDEAELARQLSRRPRGPVVALAVVALAGGVAAYGVTQGWFDADSGTPEDDGVVFESAIAAPQDPRSYSGGVFVESPGLTATLERVIGTVDGGGSELLDSPPDSLPSEVRFTPVLWGNRLQVLVTGPATMLEDACLVVSLVAHDLRALDVAARGDTCRPIHTVTGDRSSCATDGMELIEVWPPIARTDLLEPPEAVERIRVRVEREATEPDERWSRVSVRGELDLRGIELNELPVIGGEPGTDFAASLGAASGVCTLRDRTAVEVRVL